jgi:hypothetical protein
MMGIGVKPSDPAARSSPGNRFETVLETFPQLTSKTSWAEIANVPVQNNLITVREEQNRKTTLTNRGKTTLIWQAAFPGSFQTLLVNGKPLKAHSELRPSNRTITWIRVPVQPGASASVNLPR